MSGGKRTGGYHFNWLVSKIDRADGTSYDLAYYFRDFGGDGPPAFFSGYINESDGTQLPILHLYPEIDYRASDRGAMRGRVTAVLAGKVATDGRTAVILSVTVVMGWMPAMLGLPSTGLPLI